MVAASAYWSGRRLGDERADAKLSVLRHATSKIRTATEHTVMTLGFRGGIAFMASVSAFSTTSTGEGAGTNVTTDGGGGGPPSPPLRTPKALPYWLIGSSTTCRRRRGIPRCWRSSQKAAIVETMTNLAIAHPHVMFRLTEKGREVLSLPTAKDLIERLDSFTVWAQQGRCARWITRRAPTRSRATWRRRVSPRPAARARHSP